MIDLIINLFSYSKLFVSLCFFTYIYRYLYDVCNEKKIIKVKNEKPKKVIKIRNTMSFVYFILVGLLYLVLDWFSIFAILLIIQIVILVVVQKIDKHFTVLIKKYDSSAFIQKSWFVFSIIMNIIFKIFSPCHRAIDRKMNKKKEIIKNTIMDHLVLGNIGNFDLSAMLNNVDIPTNQKKDIPKENINEIEEFLKNTNKKDI